MSSAAKLKDKVVIVTGGTSGIGAAIARIVVREGGKVLITGIVESEGKALVGELGAAASLSIADLSDPSAPKKIVADCMNAFGRIDSLVNCAVILF